MAAAVSTDPFTLAVKIAAGGLSTKIEIVFPASSQVVVPVLLMVNRLKKVSVVNKVPTVGV